MTHVQNQNPKVRKKIRDEMQELLLQIMKFAFIYRLRNNTRTPMVQRRRLHPQIKMMIKYYCYILLRKVPTNCLIMSIFLNQEKVTSSKQALKVDDEFEILNKHNELLKQ